MTHRDKSAGSEVLICVGAYANHIGVLTAQKPTLDSHNWIVSVAGANIEYAPSALRQWPNGRREPGIIRPEDYEARDHNVRDDRTSNDSTF